MLLALALKLTANIKDKKQKNLARKEILLIFINYFSKKV
jgi:hypothetical protein